MKIIPVRDTYCRYCVASPLRAREFAEGTSNGFIFNTTFFFTIFAPIPLPYADGKKGDTDNNNNSSTPFYEHKIDPPTQPIENPLQIGVGDIRQRDDKVGVNARFANRLHQVTNRSTLFGNLQQLHDEPELIFSTSRIRWFSVLTLTYSKKLYYS